MLTVEIKENEKMVGTLIAIEKQFKTGSRGYFGMDKLTNRRKALSSAGSIG